MKNILPITIVIPHRNRINEIKVCVKSIQALSPLPSKVHIIDDFSDAEQIKNLRLYISQIKNLNIILSFHDKHLGTSVAKNLGTQQAQTPYIWFLDSDTEFLEYDTLDIGFKTLEQNSNVGITGAEIVRGPKDRFYLKEYYHLPSKWTACKNHLLESTIQKNVKILTTCNFLTRVELMTRIGGFNKELATSEDKLACMQIEKLGYKIYLDSRLKVLHHVSPKERPQFYSRAKTFFRDFAFVYGATSSFKKLFFFHALLLLSIWPMIKSDRGEIASTSSFFGKIIYFTKLVSAYFAAKSIPRMIKGYRFKNKEIH